MKKVFRWAAIGAAIYTAYNFYPEVRRYLKMKMMT
jgi:hypothetical protein